MCNKPATARSANLTAGVFLLSPGAVFAGDWGENWGSLVWGAGSSAGQAIPVDSLWMLAAASIAVALAGTLKLRKK